MALAGQTHAYGWPWSHRLLQGPVHLLGTYRVGQWSSPLGAARSGLRLDVSVRLEGLVRLETASCPSFALQGWPLLGVNTRQDFELLHL